MYSNSRHASRPQSIKELSAAAETIEFDPQVQIRYWVRAAGSCEREARIYDREGDYQQAFILYFRTVDLIINKIPRHPEFTNEKHDASFLTAQRNVVSVLQRLERIKPILTRRHEQYLIAVKERQAQRQQERESRQTIEPTTSRDTSPYEFEKSSNIKRLVPSDNPRVVVALAKREQRRRAKTHTRSPTPPGRSSSLKQYDHSRHHSELTSQQVHQHNESTDLQRRIQETGSWLADSSDGPPRNRAQISPRDSPFSNSYNYPSVPRPDRNFQTSEPIRPTPIRPRPPLKESFDFSPPAESAPAAPPARPEKVSFPSPAATPEVDSQAVTFPATAKLENGTLLRSVLLPSGLRSSFLKVASANTASNIETCGVLCGTLISNALYISKLVIPEQTATSDTCETTNEGALFDYCDADDLLVLGWIHTHPTQDCFMSSRDQHTHCGYQVMMPESIAIVCAPRRNPS
ncbi:MAG: hypothetical protein M1814_002560 [Vezdaea aestivalis]|nr:MAG: hypothetical protein M1814_002560 [Vezdaea aestivalis]